MIYPEFVKQFKPKGTIVKKVNEKFIVYKATSKRVPGKSYPVQVISDRIGTIDKFGFHPNETMTLDLNNFELFEYGFTDYLLLFEDQYVILNSKITRKEAKKVYRSYIVYLSPNSYLANQDIYSISDIEIKFHFSVSQQVLSILRFLELKNLDKLEPLKHVIAIKSGNITAKPKLKPSQIELLKDLGVYEKFKV